ncbi:MAG: glycosyltransferase family 4 protein [Sedimentisphaerales bacterium]
MIRLCIITTVPITVKAFFGEQLRFLQANGFDVTVITSPMIAQDERFGDSFPEGVTLKTVRTGRTIKPIEDAIALFRILAILKRGRFDIVEYATPKASLFGSIASWLVGVPVRLFLMWGSYYVTQKGIRKSIFKVCRKIVCRLSTDIAPDSKGGYQTAIKEGFCVAEKIAVVHRGSANGVDTEKFNPQKLAEAGMRIRSELSLPRGAKVFGSVTPIVGDKGVNEMVAAFVKITEQYPDTYLLIVGQTTIKDPVKPATLEIIRNHPRIRNIGWQKEIVGYFAAMDIFVLPTYREGFGVVNIEACAMQLPVISTDVPGPRESIINGETGLLVPARAVEPLVNAMKKLLDEPDFAHRLGVAGRRRVQKYYEQKQLWKAIVEHRRALLKKSGRFKEIDGEIIRV